MKRKWWKEAVAYQIYPRSFMDSNNDGIGDLKGIINKLDYLQQLGINLIWICPIYCSPNDDNGYDISDYQQIMNEFGTLEDFEELLNEVHARNMKLILDLVINHTSDEHRWFIESRKSKNNPYRDYYIWKTGVNGKEPNNWESIFGGSAWEFDSMTNEYYLHIFSKKQPDLNWENGAVRNDLYKMILWWLDKGIDGFRVDAISHIKKVKGLPNLPNPKKRKYVPSFPGHMNVDGIDVFLKELKERTFAKYDIVTVGEANGVKASESLRWVGEDEGYFNMIFQFEHLDLWNKGEDGTIDFIRLKEILSKWQEALHEKGWNALFIENHDQPRAVSTWGDDGLYRVQSAKCLATMYFLMQGTPFIYQGQEIGMTNVAFKIDDYRDVSIKNYYEMEKNNGISEKEIMDHIWKTGRDNARTPMQWSANDFAGFSTVQPWIKVNPNYKYINVEDSLKQPDSIYHYYKKLICLRKQFQAFIYGKYELILREDKQIFAYTRTLYNEQMIVITNMSKNNAPFPLLNDFQHLQLQLCNYNEKHHNQILKPYEARVYSKNIDK